MRPFPFVDRVHFIFGKQVFGLCRAMVYLCVFPGIIRGPDAPDKSYAQKLVTA